MMPVMTKEEVFAITPHTSVQCILYLKSYELSMTKGNKPFMKGCFTVMVRLISKRGILPKPMRN